MATICLTLRVLGAAERDTRQPGEALRSTSLTLVNPVIVAALRTPIGTAGHGLAEVTAADLAAPVLAALSARIPTASDTSPAPGVEVMLGNCMGPGGNVARVASLTAGLGHDIPALTVDRQCASGLSAITLAARLVGGDGPHLVLAGGVESASTAPWRFWPPDEGHPEARYTRAPFAPAGPDGDGDPDMAVANDAFAARHGITREAQDVYAARSHARAVAARAQGAFAEEIIPAGSLVADERPRTGFGTDRLARFPLLHRDQEGVSDPTMTVGNSCGINDGAAAVAVMTGAEASRRGLPGLEILASATTGNDPREPGAGLIGATRAVLALAHLNLSDVEVIEFNEAFAGQILATCAELDLDPERVCAQGGALALGHPWGASGAVLVVRLFHQLLPTPGRIGLAAIAAGGGQGVALLVRSTGIPLSGVPA